MLSGSDEILKSIDSPQRRIDGDQVIIQILPVLIGEPLIRRPRALPPWTVLASRQEHAICKLVAIRIPILHHVAAPRLRIHRLDGSQELLRKHVVHLRHVVLVGRNILEVAVPQIEQQVYRVGAVSHLPEAILGQLKAASLRSDDTKYLVKVESSAAVFLTIIEKPDDLPECLFLILHRCWPSLTIRLQFGESWPV